jgi:uncharacterized protein (DUF983 family)
MGPRRYVGSAGDGTQQVRVFACGRCEGVFAERRFPGGGDLCAGCAEDLESVRTARALWVLLIVTMVGVAVFALMAWRAGS